MTAQSEFISQLHANLQNNDLRNFRTLLQTLPQLSVNDFIEGEDNKTILFVCAQQGKTEFVRALLANTRIDVNKGRDEFNNSSLIIAAANNYFSIVKLLLRNSGINVNQTNSRGETAFFVAAYYGAIEATKILIKDHRVDVTIKSHYEKSILNEILLQNNPSAEILRILIQNPEININEKILDEGFEIPVIHLVASERQDLLITLLQREDIIIDQIGGEREENAFYRVLNESNFFSLKLLLLKYQYELPNDLEISRTKINQGLEVSLQRIVQENEDMTQEEIEALQNSERQNARNDIAQITNDKKFLVALEIIRKIRQQNAAIPFSSIAKFFELLDANLTKDEVLLWREKIKIPKIDLDAIINTLNQNPNLLENYKNSTTIPLEYSKKLSKFFSPAGTLELNAFAEILDKVKNFNEYGFDPESQSLNERGYIFLKSLHNALPEYPKNITIHPALQEERVGITNFLDKNQNFVIKYEKSQQEQLYLASKKESQLLLKKLSEGLQSHQENEDSKKLDFAEVEDGSRKRIKLDNDDSKSPSSSPVSINLSTTTNTKGGRES